MGLFEIVAAFTSPNGGVKPPLHQTGPLPAVRLQGVAVVGYCLMSNHAHRVAISGRAEVLAEAFKGVHGRYASYWVFTRGHR